MTKKLTKKYMCVMGISFTCDAAYAKCFTHTDLNSSHVRKALPIVKPHFNTLNMLNSQAENHIKGCAYLDFAKAFDSVNDQFLLSKLGSFGLSENSRLRDQILSDGERRWPMLCRRRQALKVGCLRGQ